MKTRTKSKMVESERDGIDVQNPPPPDILDQPRTNPDTHPPPEEGLEISSRCDVNPDFNPVIDHDEIQEDGNDDSEVTDPEEDQPSQDSSESTINRDFVAKKRIKEYQLQLRNKNRRLSRLEEVEKEFKEEKEKWSVKLKVLTKDVTKYRKEKVLFESNLEKEKSTVAILKNKLKEEKQKMKVSENRERSTARKLATLVAKGDLSINDKLAKFSKEVEESSKKYDHAVTRYEKMRKDNEKKERTIDILRRKISDLEKQAAMKKHEAEVRKVELRKEAEEVKMEKEKLKMEHSLRSDKQKEELTLKTIQAKHAITEAKKMKEIERKLIEANEKREAYEKKRKSAFFSSNFVSNIVNILL